MDKKKKRCPDCNSSQVYIRIKTQEIVCLACGSVCPIKKRVVKAA